MTRISIVKQQNSTPNTAGELRSEKEGDPAQQTCQDDQRAVENAFIDVPKSRDSSQLNLDSL